jgi:phosphate/sulfate permease
MGFWDAALALPIGSLLVLFVALTVAFGFEFINGFHDTANAVTTVIYTGSLRPTPAVVYSGVLNFLGVLFGGTAVAYSIVHLLPVDLRSEVGVTSAGLVMVLALLLSAVIWNLGTWYIGLPMSSSHTLIGSILGVGLADGLLKGTGLEGVNWHKAGEVLLALIFSPFLGFVLATGLLLLLKWLIPDRSLYEPPVTGPPPWVRVVLLGTCGAVSFAHGSNDGQKGMGLILLVLIGFLPAAYALDTNRPDRAPAVHRAAAEVRATLGQAGLKPAAKLPHPEDLEKDLDLIVNDLAGKESLNELERESRWQIRQAIYRVIQRAGQLPPELREKVAGPVASLRGAVEFVPLWVMVAVALALGCGTMIGYERIVKTVAEKIGKTHMSYAQGMSAETVAAATIFLAGVAEVPVSTTHVLSSGVAGTMWANGSGLQSDTLQRIALVWILTMPATLTLAALLYWAGRAIFG